MIVTRGIGSPTLVTKGYGRRVFTEVKRFIKRLSVLIDKSIPKLTREVKR